MRISLNNTNFGNQTITTCQNGISVTEELNDSNVCVKRLLYDVNNDRFIRQDKFDDVGDPIEKWWFEYSEGKQVEHFDSKNSGSYVRTIINKIVGGLKVRTEEYVSKTDPSKNYFYEITRDCNGKMLKFLCNGKKIF